MKILEWMYGNVSDLSDLLSRLQTAIQLLTECIRDDRPKRFERADGKRYAMTVKSVPMFVSDLKNKHTVYYRHKRSYYNIRPQKKVCFEDNLLNPLDH